jgi:hypothetical protein
MTAVIFSGPSLPPSCLAGHPTVKWLPPLRQGEFRSAVLDGATVLGVVDGVFETTPTVWHEEILFALDRGIPVYGAASIGALRAVELRDHGMAGVGRIFGAYRDGILDADDEVALLHGPAELDYVALTEPLVNVRATLSRAIERDLLEQSLADALLCVAREQFYKTRTWDRILAGGSLAGLSDGEIRLCEEAVALARVDQKRLDALELLSRMERHVAST